MFAPDSEQRSIRQIAKLRGDPEILIKLTGRAQLSLKTALKMNDEKTVSKILKVDSDIINFLLLEGETLLTWILKEDLSNNVIKLVLDQKPDIFQHNSSGKGPLEIAKKSGQLNKLRELAFKKFLEALTAENYRSIERIVKYYPEFFKEPFIEKRLIKNDFYEAIKNGRIDLVQQILKYCPEFINQRIDLANGRFTTPLILALEEDELNIADLLLRRDAFILSVNSENYNAIQSAIGKKAVQLLYEPCLKLLEKALETNDPDSMKKIFELDLDFTHARLGGGETLLTFSLKAPDANPDVIQYLLEQKLDIFLPNCLDETPLKIAQEKGRLAWFASKARAIFAIAVRKNDLNKSRRNPELLS